MRLARALGLDVPPVSIRYVPEPVYIVERFDRRVARADTAPDGMPLLEVQRQHTIDACQLLDRARAFKRWSTQSNSTD
jgi:serine/threonine-protein kinase HipA